MATLDQIVMRKREEQRESQEQVNLRIANNYPRLDNTFYNVFLGAHINDFSNIEESITTLGEMLYNSGVLQLWDTIKVNVSYYEKQVKGLDESLLYAYTDYRTNKAMESGCYIKLSITTPLNGKESAVVEFPFRYKQDFRYLAYVTAKLFLLALDNFCYNENRIAFIDAKISEKVADIINAIKRK